MNQISKTKKEMIVKATTDHKIEECVDLFFKASKAKNKNNTIIQKWVNVIKTHKDVESNNWGVKIKNGQWIINKFGRKLFYKI